MIKNSLKKSLFLSALFAIPLLASSCHCEHDEPAVAVMKNGHILCTDGTVMSLCDYIKSDKEAVGIVFHVNTPSMNEDSSDDNILGYAVYIHQTSKVAFADSCGVAQNTSASLSALDGNSNTYSIYTTTAVSSPMADLVFNLWPYGQSAYIPSVAELRLLYSNKGFINQRILAVGGEPIPEDDENCWLWSSTEVEGQQDNKAWLFSMNYGNIQETPKNQEHQARPIIAIRK